MDQRLQDVRKAVDSLSNPLIDITEGSKADEAREKILETLQSIRIGALPGEVLTDVTAAKKRDVERVVSSFENLIRTAAPGPVPTTDMTFRNKVDELKRAIDDLDQAIVAASNMTEGGRRRRRKTRKGRKGKKRATRASRRR